MPQIEVTFWDIDANGNLNVCCKDKATVKEQSLVIRPSSGLLMKKSKKWFCVDAEATLDEKDRKLRSWFKPEPAADAMVHAGVKPLRTLGE